MSELSLLYMVFNLSEQFNGRLPGVGESMLLPGQYFLIKKYPFQVGAARRRQEALQTKKVVPKTFFDFFLYHAESSELESGDFSQDWSPLLLKASKENAVIVFEKKSAYPEVLFFDPLAQLTLQKLLQVDQAQFQESV